MDTLETLRIVGRRRDPSAVAPVADVAADFELAPDRVTTLDAFRARPAVSLYALDHAHGGVAFVETPEDVDLLAAPFLHQAQRGHAVRVFRVPYETFHALAEEPPVGARAPLFIHSVGRCGSTLISSVLRTVPRIASISEPDVFTSVETAVAAAALGRDEAVRILRSACRLATHGLAAGDARPALKFRSEVAWIARLLDEAVPQAPTLFMYRDARRVIESYVRVLGRARGWSDRLAHVPGLDGLVAARHRRRVARRGARMDRFAYVLRGCKPLDVEMRGRWGKFLIQWLAKVHAYADLREVRTDAAALRYEDLTARPEPVLRAVFEHLGLPTNALPDAVAAMGSDSQRGTAFERGARDAYRLSARDEREMARTFRECTSLPGPDAILPGTLATT